VFTLEDLARLALVGSSNDAAAAIAQAAAEARHAANGTALLASAAASLGLSQTYALNGTGLDENGTIPGAYGSAQDMATLAGEFLKRAPDIAHASLLPSVTATSRSGFSYTLKNTNPETLHIPGLLLSKTGYTDLAGGNLAIVFDAGIGHPIAVVVLGSTKEDRFLDVEMLVRATAAQFAGLTLLPDGN
jgi:D-alanyl-D-alanine carboxypeptidase